MLGISVLFELEPVHGATDSFNCRGVNSALKTAFPSWVPCEYMESFIVESDVFDADGVDPFFYRHSSMLLKMIEEVPVPMSYITDTCVEKHVTTKIIVKNMNFIVTVDSEDENETMVYPEEVRQYEGIKVFDRRYHVMCGEEKPDGSRACDQYVSLYKERGRCAQHSAFQHNPDALRILSTLA